MSRRFSIVVIASLFIAGSFMLSSCGGSKMDGEGKVALKSYIQNAKVCVDKNHNFHCEEFEASTYSDENGVYQLSDLNVSKGDFDDNALIAEISEKSLSVSDNSPQRSTVLAAIPGMPNFISPMTTLIMVEMARDNGTSFEEAESIFKEAFELDGFYAFDDDYIVNQNEGISNRSGFVVDYQRDQIGEMYENLNINLTPEMIKVNDTVLAYAATINQASNPGSSESDKTISKTLTNVPFVQGMDFGTGYNKINSSILTAAQCVESDLSSFDLDAMSDTEKTAFWKDKQQIGDIVVQRSAERNEVSYYFEVIKSVEDLYKILDIDAKLELEIGDFTGTLEGGFMKEVSEETLSVYSLFMIDAKLADFKIVNPKLKSLVEDNYFLAKTGQDYDIEPFRKKCGDNFINVITTGGTYYGIMKIDTSSMQEKMEIEAHLKATYAEKFSLEGSVDYRIRKIFEDYNATIMTATKGVPGSLTRVSNFYELEHDVDQFYNNLAKNAGYDQLYPDPDTTGPCKNNPCLLDPNALKRLEKDATGTDIPGEFANVCIPIDSFKYACECKDTYVWDVEMARCEQVTGPCQPNPCNSIKHATKNSCSAVGSFDFTCTCEGDWGYDHNKGECVCKIDGECADTEHGDDLDPPVPNYPVATINERSIMPVLTLPLSTGSDPANPSVDEFDKSDYRKAVYQVKFESYEQLTLAGTLGNPSITSMQKEAESLLKLQRDKEVMDTLVDLWLRYDAIERYVNVMLAFPESFVGVIERDKWLRETILRDIRTYKATVKGYAAACARGAGRVCPLVTVYSNSIVANMKEYAENPENVIYNEKFDKVVWLKSRDDFNASGDDRRPLSMTFDDDGEEGTIEFSVSDLQVPEEMVEHLPMERIVYPKTCAQRKKLYATNKSSGIYTLFMGGDKWKPYLIYCDDMDQSCSDHVNTEDDMDSPTNAEDSYWCGPKEFLIMMNSSPLPENPEDLSGFTPKYNFSRYSGYGAKEYFAQVNIYDCESAVEGDTETPAEEICPCEAGGKNIYYGVDHNGDGILEGVTELTVANPVCNMDFDEDTSASIDHAIVRTEMIQLNSEECSEGGLKLLFGHDVNHNGKLDADENESTVQPLCNDEKSEVFSAGETDKAKKDDLLTTYYKLRVLVNNDHLAVVPDQEKHTQKVGKAPYGITSTRARYGTTKACGLNKEWVDYSDGSSDYVIRNSANVNLEGTPFIIKSDVAFKTDKQFDIEPVGAVWDDANADAVKRGGHLPIIRDAEDFSKYTRVMNVVNFKSSWTGLKQTGVKEYSWLTGIENTYSGIPFEHDIPWGTYFDDLGSGTYGDFQISKTYDPLPEEVFNGCVAMYAPGEGVEVFKHSTAKNFDVQEYVVTANKYEYVEQFCNNYTVNDIFLRRLYPATPDTDYNTEKLAHTHPYIVVYKNLTSNVNSQAYQFEAPFEYFKPIPEDADNVTRDSAESDGGDVIAELNPVKYITIDGEYFFLNSSETEAIGTSETFKVFFTDNTAPTLDTVVITSGRLADPVETHDVYETQKAVIGAKTYYVMENANAERVLVRQVRQNIDLQLSNKLNDGACGNFSSVNDLILTYDQSLAEHLGVIEKLDDEETTCEEGETDTVICGYNDEGTQKENATTGINGKMTGHVTIQMNVKLELLIQSPVD